MKRYLTIALLLFILKALADRNTYIEGKIGSVIEKNGEVSLGDGLTIGYKLNPHSSLEGGLSFSERGYSIIDGALVGTMPLNNIFSLMGKVGIASNLYYANNIALPISTKVGLLIGAGGKFNLSKKWNLIIEDYDITSGPNFLMAGIGFNF